MSGTRFDRISIIRHLAISASAATAYFLRAELQVGDGLLWILGMAVLLNVGTNVLSDRPGWAAFARTFSTVCGLFSWSALVGVTGGIRSPFVAGFELEIILSALTLTPLRTILTTLGAVTALWAQQWLADPLAALWPLSLTTGFLVATGALTCYLVRRWNARQGQLSARAAVLARRLRSLEAELEDASLLSRLGEDLVRAAHRLKNTVSSLRGFCRLIENDQSGSPADRKALDGLRATITRLEEITRSMVRPRGPTPDHRGQETAGQIHRAIEETIDEVGRAHPGVSWIRPRSGSLSKTTLPPGLLREVLHLLAENAAEAVGESGVIEVETLTENGVLRIDVRDNGPGIRADMRETLFRPGVTSKQGGSGFGLFLARRLVESYGGTLISTTPGGSGALFSVHLPVHRN